MFVSHKFPAQNYPINHNLCKHLRTENDTNWEREKQIKNKDKWNYFHYMPILSCLVANCLLPLLHMYKSYV